MRRLFIDPASISTGWALFDDKKLVVSGTIAVDKRPKVNMRLHTLEKAYREMLARYHPEEVHIELLVRTVHIHTLWSVGMLVTVCSNFCNNVNADIPISSWQKYTNWKTTKARLKTYKGRVESEDQLAAIGMGLYYVNKDKP